MLAAGAFAWSSRQQGGGRGVNSDRKQAVVIGAGMGGLAAAGTRLCRMVFGAGDLAADLGLPTILAHSLSGEFSEPPAELPGRFETRIAPMVTLGPTGLVVGVAA
jgi:hypothetical protein